MYQWSALLIYACQLPKKGCDSLQVVLPIHKKYSFLHKLILSKDIHPMCFDVLLSPEKTQQSFDALHEHSKNAGVTSIRTFKNNYPYFSKPGSGKVMKKKALN